MNENLRPIEILIVEDNPGDIRLTIEALKDSKLKNNLHIVENGEDAIAFLKKQGKFQNSPCLLYTSPSPRDISGSRMPSSA